MHYTTKKVKSWDKLKKILMKENHVFVTHDGIHYFTKEMRQFCGNLIEIRPICSKYNWEDKDGYGWISNWFELTPLERAMYGIKDEDTI